MRNMSFALTTEQFLNRTKTVTRRKGWKFLKPGDRVMGIRKGMGLKPGEKAEKFHAIEIVSVRQESLCCIDQADVIAEGFPEMTPDEFAEMYCRHSPGGLLQLVTRIEFKHLDGEGDS